MFLPIPKLMKTIFLCLFLSFVSYNFAQSNLTIFNNGDHALNVVFANGASA